MVPKYYTRSVNHLKAGPQGGLENKQAYMIKSSVFLHEDDDVLDVSQ